MKSVPIQFTFKSKSNLESNICLSCNILKKVIIKTLEFISYLDLIHRTFMTNNLTDNILINNKKINRFTLNILGPKLNKEALFPSLPTLHRS